MKETKIFVDTSHGRVLHGTLTGTIFQRRLNSNGIRHSDKSLPLNPQCIAQLWALGCDIIEFTVDYVGSTIKYSIPYENAIKCERKVNEYGDEDIRIPIKEFKEEIIELSKKATLEEGEAFQGQELFSKAEMQQFIFGDAYTADQWKTEKRSQKKRIDRCPY